MIKNTAGQTIGAELITASDGTAFTGAVTIYVTGDAGTQAIGSVGGGACTHEGNGYHTYAPAQAETDYDLVAFTFTGTGAVPQTVQVFTRLANPKVDVDTIKTNPVVNGGTITFPSNATVASSVNVSDVETLVTAVGIDVDAVLLDTGTDGVVVAAGSKTGYALSASGIDSIWDEVMEGSLTGRHYMKLFAAALLAKLSGAATTTVTVRDTGDTKDRIVATVDADGNRTAVTLDGV